MENHIYGDDEVRITFMFSIPDDESFINMSCARMIETDIDPTYGKEKSLFVTHWMTYSRYKTEGNTLFTYDELIEWLEELTKKVTDGTITKYNC